MWSLMGNVCQGPGSGSGMCKPRSCIPETRLPSTTGLMELGSPESLRQGFVYQYFVGDTIPGVGSKTEGIAGLVEKPEQVPS